MTSETVKIGNITITIDEEATIILTLELALAILVAIEPLVALPLWLIILIPILRADLPLAQVLFDSALAWIKLQQANGQNHKNIMQSMNLWFQEQQIIAASANTAWSPWPQEPMFGG